MPKSLFFTKRAGGTFWRCGHCGEDFNVEHHRSGFELRKMRDADQLAKQVPQAQHLMLGNVLLALICSECVKPVTAKICDMAPRSLPDCDGAGNLLGDF